MIHERGSLVLEIAVVVVLSAVAVLVASLMVERRSDEEHIAAIRASLLRAALVVEDEAKANNGHYALADGSTAQGLIEEGYKPVGRLILRVEASEGSFCIRASQPLLGDQEWAESTYSSVTHEPTPADECPS